MIVRKISTAVCVLTILLLISCVSASAQTQPGAEKQFSLRDGDHVVFYGDSITEQRLYTMAVEEYVVTRFPDLHITFFNAGVGGDKVSGGWAGPIDLRLHADLFAHDPTVITVMLGMNDGYYRPYDPLVFKTYADGYHYLVDQMISQAPKARLALIQPSPYDDVTREPSIVGGYNTVLQRYSTFVGELAREKNAQAVDFNQLVVDVLTKAKSIDAPLSTRLIPDRVHPSLSIHWIMAESLLKTWNAPPIVTAVTVHTDRLAVSDEVNTKVTDLRKAGRSFAWTQADLALPLPFPPGELDPAMDLALRSSDLVAALDQENLKVLGLAAGNYELRIDETLVGIFGADALSAGINLASLNTPMVQQARLVGMDAELRNRLEGDHLSLTRDTSKDAQTQAAHELELLLDKAMERERKDAQPVVHHYSLTPVATGKTGTQ